jgi:hypothetical protein
MNPLLKRFQTERKNFDQLRKLAESRVVRWDYWDTPTWYWDPEDLLEDRDNMVGPQKPKPATKAKAESSYGYDKGGRVVVIRERSRITPGEMDYTHLLRYTGNKLIGTRFMGDIPCDVFEATLSQGRIVRLEQLEDRGWNWKTIEWQGDKVSKALWGWRGRKPHRQLNYGKDGRVIADIDLEKPQKRIPLPKGMTMQSLTNEVRERLARAVIDTVTKAKIKQPVYRLALNYDCEGNPLLPPELGIGLDLERQQTLSRGDRDAKLQIWEPESFSLFANNRTELKDSRLSRACDLLNRELGYEGTSDPARKLILEVAAGLNKVDWQGKLNTTDDFIVYAVDTDLVDLRKNLKQSVPSRQLRKLKAAHLI